MSKIEKIKNVYIGIKFLSRAYKILNMLAQSSNQSSLKYIYTDNNLNSTKVDFIEMFIEETYRFHFFMEYEIPVGDKIFRFPLFVLTPVKAKGETLVDVKIINKVDITLYFDIIRRKPVIADIDSSLPFIINNKKFKMQILEYNSFDIKPKLQGFSRTTDLVNKQVIKFGFEVDLEELKNVINQIYSNKKMFKEFEEVGYNLSEFKVDDVINAIDNIITTIDSNTDTAELDLNIFIIGNYEVHIIKELTNYFNDLERIARQISENNTMAYRKYRKLKYSIPVFIRYYLYAFNKLVPTLGSYINLLNAEEKQYFNELFNESTLDLNAPIKFDSPYHIYKMRQIFLMNKEENESKKRKSKGKTLPSSFYRIIYALRSLGLIKIITPEDDEYKQIPEIMKIKTYENTMDKSFIELVNEENLDNETDKEKIESIDKWLDPITKQRELSKKI